MKKLFTQTFTRKKFGVLILVCVVFLLTGLAILTLMAPVKQLPQVIDVNNPDSRDGEPLSLFSQLREKLLPSPIHKERLEPLLFFKEPSSLYLSLNVDTQPVSLGSSRVAFFTHGKTKVLYSPSESTSEWTVYDIATGERTLLEHGFTSGRSIFYTGENENKFFVLYESPGPIRLFSSENLELLAELTGADPYVNSFGEVWFTDDGKSVLKSSVNGEVSTIIPAETNVVTRTSPANSGKLTEVFYNIVDIVGEDIYIIKLSIYLKHLGGLSYADEGENELLKMNMVTRTSELVYKSPARSVSVAQGGEYRKIRDMVPDGLVLKEQYLETWKARMPEEFQNYEFVMADYSVDKQFVAVSLIHPDFANVKQSESSFYTNSVVCLLHLAEGANPGAVCVKPGTYGKL